MSGCQRILVVGSCAAKPAVLRAWAGLRHSCISPGSAAGVPAVAVCASAACWRGPRPSAAPSRAGVPAFSRVGCLLTPTFPGLVLTPVWIPPVGGPRQGERELESTSYYPPMRGGETPRWRNPRRTWVENLTTLGPTSPPDARRLRFSGQKRGCQGVSAPFAPDHARLLPGSPPYALRPPVHPPGLHPPGSPAGWRPGPEGRPG